MRAIRLSVRGASAALAAAALGAVCSPAGAQQIGPSEPAATTPTIAGTAAPIQAAGNSDQTASDSGEIVVTGSRLAVQNGFQAPTPVTVVSTQQLQQAAPSSLSDALNQLPVFRNSSTPQSTGVGTTGNVGQSFLNLRSLGPQRTLILLDGRRIVPSSVQFGSTDVSILPEQIVSRVDVVTGGASAAYGSDAVAGVVNFVLDTDFTGLRFNAQGGMAEQGYGANEKINVSGGVPVGDRGHLVLSAEYYNNGGVTSFNQFKWFNSCSRITNPANNPQTIVACNVHSAGFTAGGLITSGPLKGIEFAPGSVPQTFTYGSLATTLSMVGGSGEDHGANFPAVPAVDRISAFGHFKYEVADGVTAFVEGLYGQGKAHYASTAPWEGQSTGYTIQIDNAYLPPSIRSLMLANRVTSFPMWRYNYDFGLLLADSRNRTLRLTGGVDAQLGGGWKAALYYEYGQNHYFQTTKNNPYSNRIYNAADAVVGPGGQIVCRSTLTQPGNGCVPIDLFGRGTPSRASLDYILGTTRQHLRIREDVAELNITGEPFTLWAGPVSVAFGGGYRREVSAQTVDDTSTALKNFTGGYLGFPTALQGQLGGFERSNPQPLSGHFDLKEGFGEVLLPLLRESALGKSADLNAAVRYTAYSTSGGVTTWKVGVTYQPIDDIRFRATRSRDIRAANLSELFTGATQGQSNLVDDFQPVGTANRTPVVTVRSFGNSTLVPERADTTTAGIVLQPSFFRGFSASVDYYNIQIKDAISTLGGQITIDQCFAGATALCALLHRDATGVLVAVDTPYLNIAKRTTSGIDIEASYHSRLGADATLAIRALANYVHKLTIRNPGAAIIDVAGQTGGTNGGVPHWTANLDVNLKLGSFGIYAQERYLGPGKLDVTLTSAQLDPAANHVNNVFYTDLTLTQDVKLASHTMQLFLTINNLFDRAPPLAPSAFFVFGTSNGGTNPSLFDLIGRQYTVGARVKF